MRDLNELAGWIGVLIVPLTCLHFGTVRLRFLEIAGWVLLAGLLGSPFLHESHRNAAMTVGYIQFPMGRTGFHSGAASVMVLRKGELIKWRRTLLHQCSRFDERRLALEFFEPSGAGAEATNGSIGLAAQVDRFRQYRFQAIPKIDAIEDRVE